MKGLRGGRRRDTSRAGTAERGGKELAGWATEGAGRAGRGDIGGRAQKDIPETGPGRGAGGERDLGEMKRMAARMGLRAQGDGRAQTGTQEQRRREEGHWGRVHEWMEETRQARALTGEGWGQGRKQGRGRGRLEAAQPFHRAARAAASHP